MLLLLDNVKLNAEAHSHKVHHAFAEVEWITLFFFVSLFIAVRGLEHVGAIDHLAQWMLHITHGDMTIAALTILWGSAIASAFVDNIPFVATMIPLVKSMAPAMGGEQAIMPLRWSLALGVCLGGNGSLVGASANLVVAGFAERVGSPIRFIAFLKVGFPIMLLTLALAHLYIYFRYLQVWTSAGNGSLRLDSSHEPFPDCAVNSLELNYNCIVLNISILLES